LLSGRREEEVVLLGMVVVVGAVLRIASWAQAKNCRGWWSRQGSRGSWGTSV